MIKKKEINQLKMGAILTYINLIISTIIPLTYTPIMLRMLGQSEYGLYSLSNSVVGYLGLLNFGMGSTIIRYLTKCRAENDKKMLDSIAGFFIVIYSFLAVLVCMVGFFLMQGASTFFGNGLTDVEISKLKILIMIMVISTAVSFPSSVFSSVIIVYEKYIFRRIIDGISSIILPIMNLLILFLGMKSIGMATVGLVVQLFFTVINIIYCKNKLNIIPRFSNLPFNLLREIATFSGIVFISSIADLLYWATDKVLLGAMAGTVAVAVYNVGGTFNSMLQNMSAAISNVFGTRVNMIVFSKNSKNAEEKISELLIRVGRLQYLIVALIMSGYIVFGKTFIHFWIGDEYSKAYYVALMTMLPLCIPLIQNIAFNTIYAQNKHKFRSILYVIIAIVNVVGTYLAIPKFGIIGASACTMISFILGHGVIMNIYYYKVIKLDILGFWKNILKMSFVPVVLSSIFIMIQKNVYRADSLESMLVGAGIYSIFYGVMSWVISMNNYEKNLFRDMMRKVLRRKI